MPWGAFLRTNYFIKGNVFNDDAVFEAPIVSATQNDPKSNGKISTVAAAQENPIFSVVNNPLDPFLCYDHWPVSLSILKTGVLLTRCLVSLKVAN